METTRKFAACWAAVFLVVASLTGTYGYLIVGGSSGIIRASFYAFAGFLLIALMGLIPRPSAGQAW